MLGRLTLLLAVLAASMSVQAGNVYRCDLSDGTVSYSNKRVSGAKCKLVGSYRAQAAPTRKAAPLATAADAPASNAIKPTPVAAAPAASATRGGGSRMVSGQVYSYLGKDGVRHYTSRRPAGMATASVRTIKYSYMETCYACGAKPGVNFRNLRLNMTAYQDEVRAAAREHGVDEAIVRAIIHAESAFNPNALSRVGAQGLMQLMPATARRFGVGNAFEPRQNISGGVKYLAWLLTRFNGDLTLAAAGYNAGEGAVDKYKGVPPYRETRHYVERVGILAERYRGALNPVASVATGGLSAR